MQNLGDWTIFSGSCHKSSKTKLSYLLLSSEDAYAFLRDNNSKDTKNGLLKPYF